VIVVADASVALKWFLTDSLAEDHTETALSIFEAAVLGRIQLLQPVHFIAEVAAVLARVKPTEAQSDLIDLIAIERRTVDSPEVYSRAVALATQLNHHLFDTLYHALALETPSAVFVTADRRYFDKAQHLGQIALLPDFVVA
jgi:predicted nucleic acid-binding protein